MCSPEVLSIFDEEPVAGRVSEWDLVRVGEVEEPGMGGAISRAWTALCIGKCSMLNRSISLPDVR